MDSYPNTLPPTFSIRAHPQKETMSPRRLRDTIPAEAPFVQLVGRVSFMRTSSTPTHERRGQVSIIQPPACPRGEA